MPSTQLPNARLEGLLPDDFDFDAHATIPPSVHRFEIPLASRIAQNVAIEKFNNDSILQTVNTKFAPSPRPDDLDIGPPLKAPYCYTENELQELIESEALCSALSPLPVSLIRVIGARRLESQRAAELERQVEKMKEKEVEGKSRTKLLGSLRLVNPIQRVLGKADTIVIPTIYLLGITNKCYPPLNFFTNERIETVNHSPQDVHVKLTRPWGNEDASGEKVNLLDLPKMVSLWGSDDHYSCLTLHNFFIASDNFLTALKLLCSPPEDTSTTYAAEYQKHRDFFHQLSNLEETYPSWYSFELKARRDILKGVLFDWNTYALEVTIILKAGALITQVQSSKHLLDFDDESHINKSPRLSLQSDTSSLHHYDTPSCIICGKAHRYRDHPVSAKTFDDNQPLFCGLTDNTLSTIKPFRGPSSKHISFVEVIILLLNATSLVLLCWEVRSTDGGAMLCLGSRRSLSSQFWDTWAACVQRLEQR
ncbi:hypothetical protein Hypma_008280 [Hypsizygus marmoreus]|uniref:Uncharacterized protein n=1 Tax=Hypsizygus marmoreus TaxID=39966 RepID=A0A369JTJ4_HYPMA|nr:hypothetical protein Hypma_008280 [Hypsizygus marmoreus]